MTAKPRCRSHDPERLYRMRMLRGLSMQQLATSAGVAKATVSYAESGKPVRAETLHRIAGGLGCHVMDLMWPEPEAAK